MPEMALSAINDGSDILWISTRVPAIASIYYHIYLQDSHTLYCPDDTSTITNSSTPVKQHVRELARNLLRVIDSNNYRKLALHFMDPLSTARRDDLVRFLRKRRPRLRISHLTLPCPLIQHYYLSGWSYSVAHGIDPFWLRQCQASPTQELDSPSPYIPANNTYIDMEFKLPFMLSSHEFTKKALFVYITQDMILVPANLADKDINDEMDLFQLKEIALLTIQGWIDAMTNLPSENGNTLIFIVDEASFYIGSQLQRYSQEKRKQILAHGRTQLWKNVRSLATELPIYLYLNYFNPESTKPTLPQILAWLQQRHHLCVPHSILLTWKHYCFRPEEETGAECPSNSIFTQLEQVELTSIAKYDRPKWKTEFIHLLQKIGNVTYTDQRYISPGKLNKDLAAQEASRQHMIPLLGDDPQHFDELVHETGESFDHSVSSLNEQVTHSWTIAVKHQQQQQQSSTIKAENDATESNDVKSKENNLEDISKMTDEARTAELENIADNLDHDKIRDYIANTGAYSRGEDLLHTLNHTAYSWDDDKDLLMLFSEAKGTSDKPYEVYLALDRNDDNKVITNGYCTCPVGKTGRCKHCVAVLLRFSINVDDFQQNQEQIIAPVPKQGSEATQPLRHSSDSEKSPPSTSVSTYRVAVSPPPLSSSSQTNPQQSSTQEHPQNISSSYPPQPPTPETPSEVNIETEAPPRRRVLPWDMNQQKTGKGKKRQRPVKDTTDDVAATPKNSSDGPRTPKEGIVANTTIKKSRRTNTRKKQKSRMTVDSDSDSLGDNNWDTIEQQCKKKTPSRRSARNKRQQSTTHTIDDAAMWEGDFVNVGLKTQQSSPNTSPPQASMAVFNSSIDNDDMAQLASIPESSSQLSPLRTMQQSNLSLPMTDLDLLTSKSTVVDDSDTQDEDDLPISLSHMDKSQKPLMNKDNNEQPKSGEADAHPQRQFMYNPQARFEQSTTSDLFDELGL